MIYKTQPNRDLQASFNTNFSYDYMYPAHTGISAISSATDTSLRLTGTFHDQYDWGVVEWNRDNHYEHIHLRNLPNGNFTGVTISYREVRSEHCVQMESAWFDWDDWSRLRLWIGNDNDPKRVKLRPLATPGPGGSEESVSFVISGPARTGDVYTLTYGQDVYEATIPSVPTEFTFNCLVPSAGGQEYKLSFTGPVYTHVYQIFSTGAGDDAAQRLEWAINADPDAPVIATRTSSNVISFIAKGISGGAYQFSFWNRDGFQEQTPGDPWFEWSDLGGEYIAYLLYSSLPSPVVSEMSYIGGTITITAAAVGDAQMLVTASKSEGAKASFDRSQKVAFGGASPDYWDVTIPFDDLVDADTGDPIDVTDVRSIRWAFSPKLVNAYFEPLDYTVDWTNYTVTGTNGVAKFADVADSVIVDNEDKRVSWPVRQPGKQLGNFVGGSIAYFDYNPGVAEQTYAQVKYHCRKAHTLYIGSRFLEMNGKMRVTVDGGTPVDFNTFMVKPDIGWDRVCRLKVGAIAAGSHTVNIEPLSELVTGSEGWRVWFDYLHAVVEADEPVDETDVHVDTTLATDWDTAHSLELSPQRIVWNLRTLGFHGRTNHYVGALKWYKLKAEDGEMAAGYFDLSLASTWAAAQDAGEGIKVTIGKNPELPDGPDNAGLAYSSGAFSDLADEFEMLDEIVYQINTTSAVFWAEREDSRVWIRARRRSGFTQEPNGLLVEVLGGTEILLTSSDMAGGVRYNWVVDKDSEDPVNAATLAWTKTYLETLESHDMEAVLALSQELAHEPKTSVLMARYSDGEAVWLNTPACQTAFRPETRDYFKKGFLRLAELMVECDVQPFLQFGECQWWYFANKWDDTIGQWVYSGSMGVYDDYTTSEFASRYGGTMHVFKDDWDRDDPDETLGFQPPDRPGKRTREEVLALYPNECELLAALIGEYSSSIIDFVKATVPTCKFEVLYPLDVNDGSVPNIINQPPAAHWGAAKLDAFKTEAFGYLFERNMTKVKKIVNYPFLTRDFSRTNSRVLFGCYEQHDPFERGLLDAKTEGIGDKVLWAFDQFSMRSHLLPLYKGDRTTRIVSY